MALAINAGSSSIKLALFDMAAHPILRGSIKGIGQSPHLVGSDPEGKTVFDRKLPQSGHGDLYRELLDAIDALPDAPHLVAVGHRVVHGGHDFTEPARIDAKTLAALKALTPLAPLHQPHSLQGIEAIIELRPDLAQVACFDTAFHRGHERLVDIYGLPRELTDAGVQRYGFHGLSYDYIASALPPDLRAGRVVVAHLGSGASLCAMRGGKSVDTTMGFSALDGLVMGTRSGVLDPGVLLYLLQERHMSEQQIEDLLYHKSGLLGVSGIDSDMRQLMDNPAAEAQEAVALFAYRVAREIGGLMVPLGGLDTIVFTAGIGENTPKIRAMSMQHLHWLGLRVDDVANERGDRVISGSNSKVGVLVIGTDEEIVIARLTIGATAP